MDIVTATVLWDGIGACPIAAMIEGHPLRGFRDGRRTRKNKVKTRSLKTEGCGTHVVHAATNLPAADGSSAMPVAPSLSYLCPTHLEVPDNRSIAASTSETPGGIPASRPT